MDYILAKHKGNAGTTFQRLFLHQLQIVHVTAAVEGTHLAFTNSLEIGVIVAQFHPGKGSGYRMEIKLTNLLFQCHSVHQVIDEPVHR